MSFLNELGRRKVFKVGAAYALVAWIIAQAAVLINEPLALPDWFDTSVLIALAIGFPLTIVSAWVFEPKPTTGHTFNFVLTGLLAGALIGSGAIWYFSGEADDGWTLDATLEELQAAEAAGNTLETFERAQEIEQREPGTPALADIWPRISARVSIPSDPPGARVFWRPYDADDDAWRPAGATLRSDEFRQSRRSAVADAERDL